MLLKRVCHSYTQYGSLLHTIVISAPVALRAYSIRKVLPVFCVFLFPMYSDPPFTPTFCAPRFSTPKVWIVGDSIVHWAALLARERRAWNLGLPVHITWKGKRGLRLAELRNYVTTFRDTATDPSLVIIHVGTNDIGYLQKRNLLAEIANVIYYIQGVNATVRVTWSDILPRVKYDNFPVNKQNIPDRVRRAANKYARSVTRRINGASVPHPQITHQSKDLFYRDGVHLSDMGTTILMNNIRQAIVSALFA